MPSQYESEDLRAWREWRQNPTNQQLGRVLRRVDPLVQKEVNRWSGSLARPVLEIEAQRLAADAIRSYSPNRGASLGTHIANRLKKLSRLPYTHQNIARIPEYQMLKYHTYNSAKEALRDRSGREPTVDELAQELAWPKQQAAAYEKGIRRELIESGEIPPIFDTDSGEMGMVDYVYEDLSPEQKLLFEYTTGYGGKPILSNPELRRKLGVSQGQLSYRKRQLVDRIKQLTREGGL